MEKNPLEWLYGVFGKPETYLNLLYLLLAFPLGLAYFIFLVTGVSLGFGLLILWVGLLILVGVIALCWSLTMFERYLAIHLLHVDIPPVQRSTQQPSTSLVQQIKDHLSNPVTWKGIAFLLLKFPIGLASFIITVTLLSVSLSLTFSPLIYPWVNINLINWQVNSMPTASVACVIGLIMTPLSFHAFNYIAKGLGILARVMLGNRPTVAPNLQAPGAPGVPLSPTGI